MKVKTSDYTSTRTGYQRAMEWALAGTPEDASDFRDSLTTPSFYHLVNNHKLEREEFVRSVAVGRARMSDYKPIMHEFLRDGDQLAARMSGVVKVDKIPHNFESFMFAKIEEKSERMEWLIERVVWGPAEADPVHAID